MYVARNGATVATILPGHCCPQELTQRAQRRLLHLGRISETKPKSKPHTFEFRFNPTSSIVVDPTANPVTTAAAVPPTLPPAPAIPGSIVPQNFPTTTLYTANDGTVWQFNNPLGQWQRIGVSGTRRSRGISTTTTFGTPAATSAASSPATDPGAASSSMPSAAQSVLDWLSQQTLIPNVPNWVIAAGAGFVALKLSQKQGGF